MSSMLKSRWIANGLAFFLCLIGARAIAAGIPGTALVGVVPVVGQIDRTSPPGLPDDSVFGDAAFGVSLTAPGNPLPPAAPPVAPPSARPAWPTPARFFTINQVLSKRGHGPAAVELASLHPAEKLEDAPASPLPAMQGEEPFGLFTFRASEGLLWTKWRQVEAAIQASAPVLARCRAEPSNCTAAEAKFVATIKDAAGLGARAKLALVNERVNAAIRYTNDWAQWHRADVWSAPLDGAHRGSLESGIGDCEDYAIAKYVALREAGLPDRDLRILLVKDTAVHLDHAVLAAREDGHWVVLDNRWSRLTDDTQLRQFVPLFALNADGVKLFAAPYAAVGMPPNGDNFVAGADAMAGVAGEMSGAASAMPHEAVSESKAWWSALPMMMPLL